ncbi:MAG: 30S ribosomal protein S6e [Candidatus Bathyarchaeota archaeon]|nr:MAG: 30S ribosomal protein S6e [Candidatus Bathyarchaeota archaeon]
MAKFKIVISDPEDGKSKSVESEGTRAAPLIGRKLGDEIDGSVVGMSGYKLRITGGSDKDGFPMRPNVHGGVRTSVILAEGVGFHPSREGERRRKTLRGKTITEDIIQLNMKIIERPKEKKKKGKKKSARASPTSKAAPTPSK